MLDIFGPGICIVTRTDVANATPVNIGYAQGLSTDYSATVKDLYGQNQYPLDSARGQVKVSGKITAAVVSGIAWNNVFFGETFTTGGIKWNAGEAGTIPVSGPFTITVANGSTFETDLGVIDVATGTPYIKVPSATATGRYSLGAGGVYTFAAIDTGKPVLIYYTSTVTTGQQMTVTNKLIGTSPTFQLDYYTSRNNNAFVVRHYQCQASKLSFATKLDDYAIPEFDFSCYANASGNVTKLIYPEVS